ncbi:uncharacterized mitochondrial protein AtMg00810-like [Gossypium raimondii]|uniref:uncharacterized mitochondrial protein AtMg00810-like n=1 Tax=Gossypium raimondii TaxID=29730 RepID=UPI00227A0A1F|nr:uncharacterized mitochondrial protein AtMg00810-like [Gossypium raimondii]
MESSPIGCQISISEWFSQGRDLHRATEGFEVVGHEDKVYKLRKALYGAQTAPRADDLLMTGSKVELINEFKVQMQQVFEMTDLGIMTYFLGMEVHQSDRGIFISQHSFALKILDKFCMHNCKAVSTPVAQGEKLTSSSDKQRVDERHYQSLVGCLLYLTATRPDIMFGVSLLSRFMHCCNEAHLKAAKRVLRYIKGTASFGVMFESGNQLKLEGYSDSDWAGSLDDMKIHSLQREAINRAIWLKKLLHDLNETQDEATEIWVDNQSAVAIAKNPVFHVQGGVLKVDAMQHGAEASRYRAQLILLGAHEWFWTK